jgi:predicted regulator of Ras-like GTPase activity (Roadblock/LC7/MglB family)
MFRDIFHSLEEAIPGLRSVSVVARDGIEVDHFVCEDLPHDVFSAEMNGVLKNLERMAEEYELESIHEMVIRAKAHNILLLNISQELFILAIVAPNEPTGKARYEIQRRAHQFLDVLT